MNQNETGCYAQHVFCQLVDKESVWFKMIQLDETNQFEIAEAVHCYASLWHDGKGSDLYSVLSQSEFRPGPLWTETRCLEENEYVSLLDEESCIRLAQELQDSYQNVS